MKRIALALALVLVAAASAGAAAPVPLRGAFQAKITGQGPPLDGTWRLDIAADGAYKVSREGRSLITGKAVETATTISFTKEKGPLACTGQEARPNSYRWKVAAGKLTLTPVKEPCTSRKLVLATKPLTKLK